MPLGMFTDNLADPLFDFGAGIVGVAHQAGSEFIVRTTKPSMALAKSRDCSFTIIVSSTARSVSVIMASGICFFLFAQKSLR
jgi:hypothetical protein